jgi:hypothetical protein
MDIVVATPVAPQILRGECRRNRNRRARAFVCGRFPAARAGSAIMLMPGSPHHLATCPVEVPEVIACGWRAASDDAAASLRHGTRDRHQPRMRGAS